ncbi:IS630 family transposase [Actinopolyspora erythraea]|uniref:IS630 family transposase n=1 Tax=Actinopolyspora erythraea TaxID=414996 RepID=A0A099D557_9ACTN|nr:helix-turn-helix domain-containing protein [Actinopolyspora erythraea]ASU78805.1 IS630 family transposase [Actinopolyspora erythraea]KGI81323.1 hypothetical protein IL38_11630 [Actinopolyspora erythraea]
MGTTGSRARLSLSEAEREGLSRWIRLPSTSQAFALRCRIVLECARCSSDAAVARALGVSARVVGRWRARFQEGGLAGLRDRPRSGAPRSISEEQVKAVAEAVLTEPPPNGGSWTKRTLAERVGVSPSSVVRILHRLGISTAHANRADRTATGFAWTALHIAPPESMMVLAVDDSRDPARGASRVLLPAEGDHDVVLRAELAEHLSGPANGYGSGEFVGFLHQLEKRKSGTHDVHLICHGHGTRRIEAIRRWQEQHSGLHLHFTPDKELWLRLVERYFTPLTTPPSTGRSPLAAFAAELRRRSRGHHRTNTLTWFHP